MTQGGAASAPVVPDRCDVVVVGAGAAGLCTALTAGAGGLRVLLVDKQDHVGGMLHIANGEFSGAGTRRQAERGIADDPQRHFADVLRLSHGQVDRDLAWLSVSHQGETVDWLDDVGFEFHPDTPGLVHGHEVYSVPRTYWGTEFGLSVVKVLSARLQPLLDDGRVTLALGSRVTSLLRGDGGRVDGVAMQTPAGSVHVGADAVVLATGGYDAAPDLRNRFLPAACADVIVGCLGHATGDGLLLAEELGAQVTARGFFLPVMGLIPDPHHPRHAVDYREAFLELAPAYREPHEIWVNDAGERFVREDTPSPESRERALLGQPGVRMHVVFDRRAAEQAPVPLIRNGRGDWTTARFLETCDSSPWVSRAQTLDALADELGVDAAGLRATVQAYNAAVAAGGGDAHGRELLPGPIDRPPFYGVTTVAASILSRDGLVVGTDLGVRDQCGRPIRGLYAVGEVLGNNAFAGDNYVGGMSVTPAMTLGRLLGSRLASALERSPA